MKNTKNQSVNTPFNTVIPKLWSLMPDIAKKVIKHNLDINITENRDFYNNPDSPLQHEQNWHEWGIISHSVKFLEYHETISSNLFKKWKIKDHIDSHLSQKIDNHTKADLLKIGIIFHDLGKFSHRKIIAPKNRKPFFSFKDHQKGSGLLLRSPLIKKTITSVYPFTDSQLEYIAGSAEVHYELGILRELAKNIENGYSKEFIDSEQFIKYIKKIIENNPLYAPEIGIMFLGDSLAKTSIHIFNYSFEPCFNEEDKLSVVNRLIYDKGLCEKLSKAAFQMVLNVDVSKKYLKTLFNLNKSNPF